MRVLHPTEQALARRIEDLTNELAFIAQFPNEMGAVERVVRKVAIIALIKELRFQQAWWACPVEQFPNVDNLVNMGIRT